MSTKEINSKGSICLLYGTGFALNVYLPALVSLGINKVFIHQSIYQIKHHKNNIEKYKEYIHWVNEENYKSYLFNYVIIALPPEKQYRLLFNQLNLHKTNTLILEKPLAKTPAQAIQITEKLESLGISYLINYSFRYANWFKKLTYDIHNLPSNIEIFFNWKFKAKHFIHKRLTWKKLHSEGGGAIRFYGIHLIAILSDIGYTDIEDLNISFDSFDELNAFSCSYKSTNELPKCKSYIDSKSSDNEFICYYIKDNKKISLLNLNAPFPHTEEPFSEDPRILITKRLIEDTNHNYKNLNAIKLWEKIEDNIY